VIINGNFIQISEDLHKETCKKGSSLKKRPMRKLIWDLVEDSQKLTEQTKKEIAHARGEIEAGKFHTLAEVKKDSPLKTIKYN